MAHINQNLALTILLLITAFAYYHKLAPSQRWIPLLIAPHALLSIYFFPSFLMLVGITIFSYTSGYILTYTKQRWILFFLLFLLFVPFVAQRFVYTWHPIYFIGTSFYLLKAVSYMIDVWANRTNHQKKYTLFATYLAYPPQLLAGPIQRSSLMQQLANPKNPTPTEETEAGRRILWGISKKILVANTISPYVAAVYTHNQTIDAPFILLAVCLYSLQIYADFSAYNDIVLGSSSLLGIRSISNFSNPYLSTSVTEFWGRWHISLSQWLRDYIYIPLGGSKHGWVRYLLALSITFLVSAFWHGAKTTFLFWGLLQATYIGIERAWKIRLNTPANQTASIITTFILLTIAWIPFRAETTTQMLEIIIGMLRNTRVIPTLIYYGQWDTILSYINTQLGLITIDVDLALLALCCTIFYLLIVYLTRADILGYLSRVSAGKRWFLYYVLGIACVIVALRMSDVEPGFIYGRF